MSHVASQARGEVHGSGFLNDSALETRADMEGSKAAHGESAASASLKKSPEEKKGNWFTNLFRRSKKADDDDELDNIIVGDPSTYEVRRYQHE